MSRVIEMRKIRDPLGYRSLTATILSSGALEIHGHDIGGTAAVSDDGEYEWYKTFPVPMLPALLHLLGADAGEDILDVIQSRYCGAGAEVFEELVRESDLKPELFVIS